MFLLFGWLRCGSQKRHSGNLYGHKGAMTLVAIAQKRGPMLVAPAPLCSLLKRTEFICPKMAPYS